MPKARAEFLIKASAFPRAGQPGTACAPRVRVGVIEKTLRELGETPKNSWK
jgi:hypothetical protein